VGGEQLPRQLDQVTVVPVPHDPATGKAFEYKLDGEHGDDHKLIPGEPLDKGGLRLKVTLRK
jgi:hypothetical protein